MTASRRGSAALLACCWTVLLSGTGVTTAMASTDGEKHPSELSVLYNNHAPTFRVESKHSAVKIERARLAYGSAALQCVPFARAASGIAIKGNAVNWWDAAAGVYERGQRPEPGSVLNFRANGHMRLGHVAVVTNILNSRLIEIDHANWSWAGRSNISRGIKVVDVSPRNNWSMVQVELGHTGEFGSNYMTYGFIYDRPDVGRMTASDDGAPGALAPRPGLVFDEVAEAPAARAPTEVSLPVDAPDHSLR